MVDYAGFYQHELDLIKEAGLYKNERIIESPQSPEISVNGKRVINFCANNYLGLSNNNNLIAAAKRGMDRYGLGLSSVRFICGTQTIHKTLETKISEFLSKQDTILYTSCFDANGGLFETLLGEKDAIISDALNHASIIDGIRLAKAMRYRYAHGNLEELENLLKDAKKAGAEKLLIATDGVFSMDGSIAKLQEICSLAKQYGALVMVDDSHATGFFGPTGRGAVEHCGVLDKVDIITSTLGKALGGACGGFTTGPKPIIDFLRQRSRPYLFSNSLPPSLVAASLECLSLISEDNSLIQKLNSNTKRFREGIVRAGFTVKGTVHPIVPIMLGDAKLASLIADDMLKEGIYVIGFSYPVVPKGEARIRVQISAAHTSEQIDRALDAFIRIGKNHGVIK